MPSLLVRFESGINNRAMRDDDNWPCCLELLLLFWASDSLVADEGVDVERVPPEETFIGVELSLSARKIKSNSVYV